LNFKNFKTQKHENLFFRKQDIIKLKSKRKKFKIKELKLVVKVANLRNQDVLLKLRLVFIVKTSNFSLTKVTLLKESSRQDNIFI